ncbi:hypothetical protein H1R20_g8123, partial [Candolleomyces eurysporus]
MSTSDPLALWCFFIDSKGQIFGQEFIIHSKGTDSIADLKKPILKAVTNDPLPAASLRVGRAMGLKISDADLEQKVLQLYECNKLQLLKACDTIGDLGLKEGDILVIDLPKHQPGNVAGKPHLQKIPQEYRHLVMSVAQQGTVMDSDLELNNIIEERKPNSTIQAIQKYLGRPRHVNLEEAIRAVDEMSALIAKRQISKRKNSAPSNSNNNVLPGSTNNAGSNDNAPPTPSASNDITMSTPDMNPEVDNVGYLCSVPELLHLQTVWVSNYSATNLQKPRSSNKYPRYTKTHANAAIFFPFAFGLGMCPDFTCQLAGYSWPITFFIETDKQLYSYDPSSDFQLQHGGSVRFLAKVQSVSSQEDRCRMLLQAACFVKFANNHFEMYKEKKNFFLVAAYILDSGVAKRYIVFQDENDPGKVKYSTPDEFGLNVRTELIEFLRELYNLTSWTAATESEQDLQESQKEVSRLTAETSPAVKAAMQQKTTYGGDESIRQIEAENYDVVRPVVHDSGGGSWRLLSGPPSPNIWIVFEQSDIHKTNPLIAKRVSKPSRELEILQYLHAKTSPSPYIIALYRHFAAGSVGYLIFPQLNRFDENSLRHKRVKQPCQSLINGVAYLHANRVAHLDLKPDNLLYDAAGQLKIIDFDIAVLVRDEEEKIEGYRGTHGWTAPEIGHYDGPKQSYSAIKADRWACGRLLQEFLVFEPIRRFSSLAEHLMAENPNERPSLVQWCDPQVDRRRTRAIGDEQGDIDVPAPPIKKAKMA